MCDIDKELVLRGAAYFATYAAEREPPRPDPFTARLMAQALRSKVTAPPPVAAPKAAPGKAGSRARALLEENRTPHSKVQEPSVRVLTAFREKRGEAITPTEIAKLAKIASPSDSGSLHAILGRMIVFGLVEKAGKGLYRATAKGLS